MSDAGESGDINESFEEDENKVDIGATCVNLDCVKNEPNEEALGCEGGSHATRYRITLGYNNIFGGPSQQIKIEEDSDNLIGFLDNDVIMENAMIKLDVVKEEDDGSLNNFHCNKCKGIYKGYCLKCSTLSHILNNNLPFINSEPESNTIPTDILEIREISRGKGVYLLRTLPTNIIFGPFEGISGIESTVGYSWKIIDNKLSNIKFGNWMKRINCAASASLRNLDIFQNDSNLYFQTNREITEGEELLIYYDDEELQHLENSEVCLFTPNKQEKLSKIFACTMCCLGFGSNKCLMGHKRKCKMEHSRTMKEFVLIECHYCKMWMEKWEHEEHHVAYCLEKHHRMRSDYSEAVDQTDIADGGTKDGKRTYQSAIETNNKSRLKNNLNKHRGIKQYQCDICMMKFTRKDSLMRHIKNKHTDDGIAKDYKCSECSYQTNSKSNFQGHLNKHKGITFQCDICMMQFTQNSNLKAHIKNKHTGDGNAKDYKCSECSFATSYKHDLKRHLKRHTKNKHADNAKDYRCLECAYQTIYKYDLQKHLNKHRGIRPFRCDICMMTYSQKGHLNMHIKDKHTDDGSGKDYQCLECIYRTNSKSHFQRHQNKHSGIKPFQCDICMMKFGQNGHLARHIKNKHTDDGDVKDYKCSHCSFQTKYKTNLQIHLNKHSGIKPFECHICMTKFTQKGHLKMHLKNKHTVIS